MAKLYKNPLISKDELFLNQSCIQSVPCEEEALNLLDEPLINHIQKEAYEQGYSAGKTDAQTNLNLELNQLKNQLNECFTSIPQAIAQNRLDLGSEIADVVLLIIQQFFIEYHQDTKALTQQINQILHQLNNKHSVELYLHPQDLSALQQAAMQLDATHLNGLKIKSDESLILGGCIIKTDHGMFDASLEKQIDKLKDVLVQLKYRGTHAKLV